MANTYIRYPGTSVTGTVNVQIQDLAGNVVGPMTPISGVNYMPVILPANSTVGSAVPTRGVSITGSDGTNARILSTDTTGRLNINVSGTSEFTSIVNSTTATLAANATFTGTFESITNYAAITVVVNSNVSSATNGLIFEFSADGTNVILSFNYTYTTGNGFYLQLPSAASFFRLRYTNGATLQTSFTIQTLYSAVENALTSGIAGSSFSDFQPVSLTKSILSAKNGTGAYSNVSFGQSTMANSLPMVLASDQSAIPASQSGTWNITNISGTVSLPTGAATATLQTTGNTSLGTIATNTTNLNNTIGATGTAVPTFAQLMGVKNGANQVAITQGSATSANSLPVVIASDQGAVPASQSGTWNITNISGTVSLPTGAATATLQTTGNTSLGTIATNTTNLNNTIGATGSAVPTFAQLLGVRNGVNQVAITQGQATMANSLPVVLASDQTLIATSATAKGTAFANTPVQLVYSTTNVTTAAFTQLIASTTFTANTVQIFDSSGQAMILAVGAAGSEINQIYVPPGGDKFSLLIASGSRVSIKALTATANSGYILLNLLQ